MKFGTWTLIYPQISYIMPKIEKPNNLQFYKLIIVKNYK